MYSVLRLLAFLVPLGILWFFFPIFREFWWLAALFAALIGISISLLFLRAPLSDASRAMYAKRSAQPGPVAPTDEDIEDSEIDADDTNGTAARTNSTGESGSAGSRRNGA